MASIQKRPNGKWRARADRDEDGKEATRHFDTKTAAQKWLDDIVAARVTGTYVDPAAGKITFKEYAESWRKCQTHGAATANKVESTLRVHCYPGLGSIPMSRIRNSQIRAWLAGLQLADSSKNIALGHLKSVFAAAVLDKVIGTDPTIGVKLPSRASVQDMFIPTWKQVNAIRAELPDSYKGMVDVVIGSGLRLGEFLGLEVDCIDFLKTKSITVRQQRHQTGGPLRLDLPKTVHSRRSVPVASVTLDQLSAHIAKHPKDCSVFDFTPARFRVGETDPEDTRRTARLMFPCMSSDRLMWAQEFRVQWNQAAKLAGWPTGARTGVHCLRHFYASALIRHGESVTTVCHRLGHANPNITLGIYAHLWPDSDYTTRKAIEAMYAERDEDNGTSGLAVVK